MRGHNVGVAGGEVGGHRPRTTRIAIKRSLPENRVYRVYLVALLWGLVAALIALIVMRGHHALPKDLKSVRDLLTAVLLFFAGRIGKRQGAKAIGVGMVPASSMGWHQAGPPSFRGRPVPIC